MAQPINGTETMEGGRERVEDGRSDKIATRTMIATRTKRQNKWDTHTQTERTLQRTVRTR